MKSTIRVTAKTETGLNPSLIGVRPRATGRDMFSYTRSVNVIQWPEDPRSKTMILSARDTGSDASMITMTCSTKQANGAGLEREKVVTQIGTNPTAEWEWIVDWGQIANTASVDMRGQLYVQIIYDVIFSSPKASRTD